MAHHSLLVVLIAACTAHQPEPARTIVARPVPEAPQDPAPSEPAAEPTVPALPSWWCTCYAEKSGAETGGEPITACRQTREDCQKLADKAAMGGSDAIVAGSLTHSCREIRNEHPGDTLGGRERWRPSKKPGSWVSSGACMFSEPPDVVPSIANTEEFGHLRRGMPARAVVALLGEPGSTTTEPDEIRGGRFLLQNWSYPELDLELVFTGPRKRGPWTVDTIRASARCALRTSRDIGMGSTRSEVVAAYTKDFRKDADEDDEPEPPSEEIARQYAAAAPGTEIVVGGYWAGGITFRLDPTTDQVIELEIRGGPC